MADVEMTGTAEPAWELFNLKGNRPRRTVYAVLQHRHSLRRITVCIQDQEVLESRIVNAFLGLDAMGKGGRSLIPPDDIKAMVETCVSDAIAVLGDREFKDEEILNISTKPDSPDLQSKENFHSFYPFVRSLKTISELVGSKHLHLSGQPVPVTLTPLSEIRFLTAFSSYRGGAMKVLTKGAPDTLMVYKGLSFADYLAFDPPTYRNHLAGIYRELEMLSTVLSPHPNIMPPPLAFATFQQDRYGEPLICGALYPYYPKLSVAAAIGEAIEYEVQIPLHYKARWCFQLASALYHAHSVDGAWHQDLKTANTLLDNDANLIVIDWEQCGANSFTLAPEANGEFDLAVADMAASEVIGDDAPVLYKRYTGPSRRNNWIGSPGWVVFAEWKKQCPKAVELAEVWSLGTVMWQLLEQVALDHLQEIVDVYGDGIKNGVVWTTMTEEMPESWREVVGACRRKEPNERIRMKELVEFWRREAERLEG
ncbi:hypothetical protein BU16DRAFT_520920 [Lophium mytilinum]|uniref:Protein kinase domain-containing protein n=1 Tax=Lophium mytilinum TaxID=390894 RepID=A0A6A6RC62_9PEZI|nr:hypothetical protein BU16DRAFT_520920 [Lophium mytilinum]